jgi:hypothetical protein
MNTELIRSAPEKIGTVPPRNPAGTSALMAAPKAAREDGNELRGVLHAIAGGSGSRQAAMRPRTDPAHTSASDLERSEKRHPA